MYVKPKFGAVSGRSSVVSCQLFEHRWYSHASVPKLERLDVFFANPKWKYSGTSQEAQDGAIQKVKREFSSRVESYVSRRFRQDYLNEWCAAYARSGRGSGRERSYDVRTIDESVASIPGEQKVSKLFDDVRALCAAAIDRFDDER